MYDLERVFIVRLFSCATPSAGLCNSSFLSAGEKLGRNRKKGRAVSGDGRLGVIFDRSGQEPLRGREKSFILSERETEEMKA